MIFFSTNTQRIVRKQNDLKIYHIHRKWEQLVENSILKDNLFLSADWNQSKANRQFHFRHCITFVLNNADNEIFLNLNVFDLYNHTVFVKNKLLHV